MIARLVWQTGSLRKHHLTWTHGDQSPSSVIRESVRRFSQYRAPGMGPAEG
jgi:hypothetical protein